MKKLLLAYLLFLTWLVNSACSEMNQFQLASLDQSSSSGQGENNGQTEGEGPLTLNFLAPQSTQLPRSSFEVKVDVAPLEDLKSLELVINDKKTHRFTRTPFVLVVNPSEFPGDTLKLELRSKNRGDKGNRRVLILSREPSQGPGGDIPDSKSFGQFDQNCLNNPNFDACLFWKNPVAQRGQAYPSLLRFGQSLSEQTFGIRLSDQTSPDKLENQHIRVFSSSGPTAQPGNGSTFRLSYAEDRNRYHNAQLMSYFWLNIQQKEMSRRAGTFYASNKRIPVDAFNSGVENNAYWDTQKIVMGMATSGGNSHEMALSSDVLLHEMGHANLQFAVGRFLRDNHPGATNGTCSSALGCISAINEGQADFHFLMIFQDSTALGETFVNSTRGIAGVGNISRNVKANPKMTIQEHFSRSQGQIHTMGTLYATILYRIYTDPRVNKIDFEKIFMNSLQKLSESSRFPETKAALLAEDRVHFSEAYKTVIEEIYAEYGL
jgi:hypothetical protein